MRYPLFLLLNLSPNDDNLPTQATPRMNPDFGRSTQPMPPSPYPHLQADVPPPPPPQMDIPWRGEDPTMAAGPNYPRNYPPAPPPSQRNNTPLFLGVIMISLALALVAGAVFAVAISKGGHTTPTTTTGQVATHPPNGTPTHSPTAVTTPTPPTATIQAGAQTIPSAPQGFSQYVSASGLWGLDMPNGVNPSYQDPPIGDEQAAEFAVVHHGKFVVYTFHSTITTDQFSAALQQLIEAYQPSNVQQGPQGAAQIGQNTWQSVQFTITSNDQDYTTRFLYSTHGANSVIISMSAPVDSYNEVNQRAFQEMLISFTYLQ